MAIRYAEIANKNLVRCGYDTLPVPRRPRDPRIQKRKYKKRLRERELGLNNTDTEQEVERQKKKGKEDKGCEEQERENENDKERVKKRWDHEEVTDSQKVRNYLGDTPPPPSQIPLMHNPMGEIHTRRERLENLEKTQHNYNNINNNAEEVSQTQASVESCITPGQRVVPDEDLTLNYKSYTWNRHSMLSPINEETKDDLSVKPESQRNKESVTQEERSDDNEYSNFESESEMEGSVNIEQTDEEEEEEEDEEEEEEEREREGKRTRSADSRSSTVKKSTGESVTESATEDATYNVQLKQGARIKNEKRGRNKKESANDNDQPKGRITRSNSNTKLDRL